jgi:hypothetical protein
MYENHPWLLDIQIEGTPLTPNNLAWLDSALEALAALAIDYDTKIACVLAVIAQVRWESIVARGYVEAAKGENPDMIDLRAEQMLLQLVTPEEFPRVHAALAEGAFKPVPNGNPFNFGLERVLDGIEAFLAGSSPAAPIPADRLTAEAMRDQRYKEAVKARRESEKHLREARKKEREALAKAKERLSR